MGDPQDLLLEAPVLVVEPQPQEVEVGEIEIPQPQEMKVEEIEMPPSESLTCVFVFSH